jgi:hypothetical protein
VTETITTVPVTETITTSISRAGVHVDTGPGQRAHQGRSGRQQTHERARRRRRAPLKAGYVTGLCPSTTIAPSLPKLLKRPDVGTLCRSTGDEGVSGTSCWREVAFTSQLHFEVKFLRKPLDVERLKA